MVPYHIEQFVRQQNYTKKKTVNAIVTAPISKESLHLAGYKFDGHTGLLGSLFNIEEPYLMLANKKFSTFFICMYALID